MSIIKSHGGEGSRSYWSVSGRVAAPRTAFERINTFNLVLRIECGRANNPVFVVCFLVFFNDTFHRIYREPTLAYKYHVHPHILPKKRCCKIGSCFRQADKMRNTCSNITNIRYFRILHNIYCSIFSAIFIVCLLFLNNIL